MSSTSRAPTAGSSIRALFRSDYLASCARRSDQETPRRRRLLVLPRLLVSPSLQVVLVLRVANASPRATWWIWRNYFVRLHSMDWTGRLEIGPRLEIPHPVGLVLAAGSRIGADVGLGQHVTLGGGQDDGRPEIGDRVTVYPGAVIFGGVRIGDDCIVGANSVVSRDLAPGMVITPRGVRPIGPAKPTP